MSLARGLGVVLAVAAGLAQAQSPDTLGWLRKIHDATHKLSYSGTFVYQHGGRSETSRITRYVDASGDIERLEALDGQPREIVRTRDSVRCYLPDSRVVKVEKRTPDRSFPALLPEKITALARHYDISLGETRRIGGFDCQSLVLTPRDNLRYGYKLYADVKSGMLLKAVTLDAAGDPVEQFMFTQLAIGGVTRDMVQPSHAALAWRVEDADAAPARLAGWGLTAELPGFRKVIELKRRMGESKPVGQLVYSDGLAAVSVFIEPLEGRREAMRTGLASMGAIHIYTREVANHMVTVVGDTPAASVQRIANAVEYRRPQ
ncbi:MAG TPA: MucB/RseB C-terminal domain-containing protein [Burkholderiales bacterium]|nr:MucB/RseB C-terminal domain-containing protein [Burkholderiales bacterium]